MKFISHAQNLEDVILWRALSHVRKGFYVDVGAMDPVLGSVTLAFYQRGWRGINFEPDKQCFEKLVQQRPEDTNLMVAAGRKSTKAPFYLLKGTGYSTAQPDIAEKYENQGSEVETVEVTVTTLNSILEVYSPKEIHFLKIDVEGYELDVLLGIDLRKWRPWILVVESTIPDSPELNYETWDGLVRGAGYQFVYFDGLNRFYLADEKLDLNVFFQAPPNVFDGFTTAKEEWLESLVNNLTIENKELKSTHQQKTDETVNLQVTLHAREQEYQDEKKAYELLKANQINLNNELIEIQRKYIESLEINNTFQQKIESLQGKYLESLEINNTYQKEIESIQSKYLESLEINNSRQQEIESIHQSFELYRSKVVSTIAEILPEFSNTEPEQLRTHFLGLKEELEWVKSERDKSQHEIQLFYQSKTYRLTGPLRRIYWFFNRLPNRLSASTRSSLKKIMEFSSSSGVLSHVKYPIKKIAPSYWEKTRLGLWRYSTGEHAVLPTRKTEPDLDRNYFYDLFIKMIN